MAGKEGMQRKLSRVRPPRVHIVTDVETGKAVEMPELPFVVGVLGEFSGHPKGEQTALRDRRFVEITPDNFDKVLESMKPRLSLRVDNRLEEGQADAGQLSAELEFKSLEDFEPHRVAEQVPYLRKLVDLRSKLNDLRADMDGRENFEELLDKTIRDTETRKQLAGEIQKFKQEQPK
jgi:type VI secretion system protein ImpB